MLPSGRAPDEAEADHVRDEHGDGLAEHGGLRLDAADAPAEHADAVGHGGVAVRAEQRVRVGDGLCRRPLFGGPDGFGEVLDVDLVADAGAGGDDAEVLEGALAPAEEGVALAVAGELGVHVLVQRVLAAGEVDHDRVVDDEVNWDERVYLVWRATECLDAVAHGGKVDDGGDTREVLHEDAGGAERDFLGAGAGLGPLGDRTGVIHRVAGAVLEAEHVLQQDLEAHGQAADVLAKGYCGFWQRKVGVGVARGGEGVARLEAVVPGHRHRCGSLYVLIGRAHPKPRTCCWGA